MTVRDKVVQNGTEIWRQLNRMSKINQWVALLRYKSEADLTASASQHTVYKYRSQLN